MLSLLLALAAAPAVLQEPAADASVLSAEGRAAARAGLRWLAREQAEDGAWRSDVGYKLQDGYALWRRDASHIGVTALAGMAFLAGGHVPGRGPYGAVVEKALDYILRHVDDQGFITHNETRMYSHAFATLFLAEVYGMTDREDVRGALQRAVDLIVNSQNRDGGWRYNPHAADADMSVTVCQVVALRAARNIGIQVPAGTIDRAIQYVKKSAVREGDPTPFGFRADPPGSFRYQPHWEARATFALTAAGLTTLNGAGVYADEDIERGLRVLEDDLRRFSSYWGQREAHYFFYYGHYYAVQAFHIAGGERWRRYFEEVERVLLSMQTSDGSWPNHTGPGPAYSTATACLILQIPREYLPIFQR